MINVFIPDEIPLMMFSKKFPVEEATLVFMVLKLTLVEDPFTLLVRDILFDDVETVRLFEFAGVKLDKDVVDVFPFTFEVKVFPDNEMLFVVVVAITFPFASTASNVLFSPVSVVLADVN